MKIYQSTDVVNIHTGRLLVNKDQAARRNHVLVKQDDSIKSLNLSDEELEFLNADSEKLAVFKLIGSTQFKVVSGLVMMVRVCLIKRRLAS